MFKNGFAIPHCSSFRDWAQRLSSASAYDQALQAAQLATYRNITYANRFVPRMATVKKTVLAIGGTGAQGVPVVKGRSMFYVG